MYPLSKETQRLQRLLTSLHAQGEHRFLTIRHIKAQLHVTGFFVCVRVVKRLARCVQAVIANFLCGGRTWQYQQSTRMTALSTLVPRRRYAEALTDQRVHIAAALQTKQRVSRSWAA
jgi:hypothetical protein